MRRMGIGLGVGINRSNYAQGIFSAYQSRVVADGGVTEAGNCVNAVSSLLQSASLLLIPSGYKSGKAYAEIPTNGNGDLTWTRASTALRTNSSGLLESMGSGVPRLSYMYGSCPALLLEPQRTNLALQSESFDNASWTKANASVTANSTTAPDGNTTADTFESTTNINANITIQQAITIVSGSTYSASFYVKANTQRYIFINLSSTGAIQHFVTAVIDTNDFTVGQTAVGTSSGTLVTTNIQSAANGFYRITIVASINRTDGRIRLGFADAKTGNFIGLTGECAASNTSGKSVYLWGAQLEAGAYPTTYIPTTSASATRIADSFSRNNIYTNGLITSSGGTWFVELRGNLSYTRDGGSTSLAISTTSADVFAGSTGIEILANTGLNRLSVIKRISGTATTLYLTTTDTVKIAVKWNGTSADVFVNGTKQVSATSFTTTNMEFLKAFGADVPKFIQQMALYPSPLSDTDCTTLTTL
jgi:hypothetical protein